MKVRFSPEAQQEYFEAVAFYVENASREVARQLTDDLVETAGLLAAFPTGFPKLQPPARHCQLRIFPYQLIYFVDKKSIQVVAFMHTKQRPGYWAKRIPKSV